MARRTAPISTPGLEPHKCTLDARLTALAKNPLFAELPDSELHELDAMFTSHGYAPGEPLYVEGDPAREIFLVVDGAVRLVKVAASGRQTLLDVRVEGDTLGAPLAMAAADYADSGWALTNVCALVMHRDRFQEVLTRFPSVALAALQGTSQDLSRAQTSLHNLAATSLKPRLAATLLLLQERVGKPWEGGTLIDVPLTRTDLAAMCATSPESVSRLLGEWKTAGLIDSGRRWVAVMDEDALAEIAETL